MKLTRQDLLLILIGILIIMNLFNTNVIRTDVKQYKAQIEHLQTSIDSTKLVNNKLQFKIDSVKSKVSEINLDITKIDRNLVIIKNQTNEKISNVDTFTASDLKQFFTERYD